MGIAARGKTALYDAIEIALTHLRTSSRDKKALIVISDGGDNASSHTLKQVLPADGRSDAMIYTIGLFDEDDPDRNPHVLKRLCSRIVGKKGHEKGGCRGKVQKRDFPAALGNAAKAAGFPLSRRPGDDGSVNDWKGSGKKE